MAVLGAALPTAEDVQETKNSVYEIKDTGGVKELWQGFKEENLCEIILRSCFKKLDSCKRNRNIAFSDKVEYIN